MATSSISSAQGGHPRVAAAQLSGGPQAGGRTAIFGIDRGWLLVLLVAGAVVVPRSFLIARAHSESYDDDYHLQRGLLFLTRSLADSEVALNDPPLGEGLIALPMLVTNLLEGRAPADDRLYDTPGRAETIAIRTALWNSTLFLGFLAVVCAWCRRIYGWRSAALAVGLFVIDPNFAGHVPVAALDVLGVESIVIAALLAWRYFERPTTARLWGMGFGIAMALLVKHTALAVPVLVLALAALHWIVKPMLDRQESAAWRQALFGGIRRLALLAAIVPFLIWALTLFDCSPPMNRAAVARQEIGTDGGSVSRGKAIRVALERRLRLESPWPAGCYLHAFRLGLAHGTSGHQGYLNGEWSDQGWPSYFPILASYKIPVGIGVVLLLALVSLGNVRPRWVEWGLAVPFLVCALLALSSKVNIGFRHFLPAYAFMLMLGSRSAACAWGGWRAIAWTAVAAAGAHALSYHPDYVSYINAPWRKPYLAISDSNVDWGQALKQVGLWLDRHPPGAKKVSLFYFGKDNGSVEYYLHERVEQIDEHSPRPTSGWLLISPVRLLGIYEEDHLYSALFDVEPDAVIAHSILAFDLDRLGGGSPFRWPVPQSAEVREPRGARRSSDSNDGHSME
jgi:hypothetical protein